MEITPQKEPENEMAFSTYELGDDGDDDLFEEQQDSVEPQLDNPADKIYMGSTENTTVNIFMDQTDDEAAPSFEQIKYLKARVGAGPGVLKKEIEKQEKLR